MALDTIFVEPPVVRSVGKDLEHVGKTLGGDAAKAGKSLHVAGSSAGWAVTRASQTLAMFWGNYLTGLGETVEDYGDRLQKIADAYEHEDREAAAALDVILPQLEPGRERRSGSVPR